MIRDRINDASFRQNLDHISKNILRRQNPLKLVFEDISTFDAENPIVRALLREIDLNKKQAESDFIKSLPSHPGKEFEIPKHLGRLGEIKRFGNNNNNNNNNNSYYNITVIVIIIIIIIIVIIIIMTMVMVVGVREIFLV